MDLSLKWLSDYIDVSEYTNNIKEFCERMTMSGSKVEGFKKEGSEITNTVVGKILSVLKHPDAEKLVVCQVFIGKEEPIQIVTAATNVFEGAIVPVALNGSTLCGGIKIKTGKLRGVVSEGMFCSVAELGVTVSDFPYAIEDGILIIEEDCKPGDDIKLALGLTDTIVEFEITNNRSDCFSVIGLAREASATFNKPLLIPEIEIKNQSKTDNINDYLTVNVLNDSLCTRYAAKMVKNVKIKPSPRWLRERLRSSGIRPINNIVDITNFVCLEYGHPMHAFDYKYVNGKKIIVRNAKNDEKITTLDGIERTLSDDMLVIADEKSPVAVAGVMGGEFSGIMEDTETIVFEAACFNNVSVRKTSRKLGLRTESSSRFEKGLTDENAYFALMRACQLIEILDAGIVVGGEIDIYNNKKQPTTLPLDYNFINNYIGIDLTNNEIDDILKSLSFKVENGVVTEPYFRTDIVGRVDIAEEVARIYGYNNVPSTPLTGFAIGKLTDRQKFIKKIDTNLINLGLSEIITYSFISPKYYDKIKMSADNPLRDSVVISNPLGEDTSIMRTTALPSMLEIVSKNYNNRNESGSLYEIATEYIKNNDAPLPSEPQVITIGLYGENYDFFTLKGIICQLLDNLKYKNIEFVPNKENPSFHPGRCADIYLNISNKNEKEKEQILIGTFGEIHPDVCENYSVNTKVFAAKISIEKLIENIPSDVLFTPLPKFPKVTRDLALICEEKLMVGEIEKVIKKAGGNLIEDIKLFDIYKGKQIESGKKSVAYSVVLRSNEKTLTDKDSDIVMKRILKRLSEINVVLRS